MAGGAASGAEVDDVGDVVGEEVVVLDVEDDGLELLELEVVGATVVDVVDVVDVVEVVEVVDVVDVDGGRDSTGVGRLAATAARDDAPPSLVAHDDSVAPTASTTARARRDLEVRGDAGHGSGTVTAGSAARAAPGAARQCRLTTVPRFGRRNSRGSSTTRSAASTGAMPLSMISRAIAAATIGAANDVPHHDAQPRYFTGSGLSSSTPS